MEERDNEPRWTASGNFETVRFDVVEPPEPEPITETKLSTEIVGYIKEKNKKRWWA